LTEPVRKHLTKVFRDEVIELEKMLNLSLNKFWPDFFTDYE